MENGYSFFALLFRQKYIKRWSLMRCAAEETLSQHSMECAAIAHCLATINKEIFKGQADSDKVAVYALFHDASEVLCGDLPSPVKYSDGTMRSVYGKIEEASADALLSKLPDELRKFYDGPVREKTDELTIRLVKTADKLCALIKCTEELKWGNNEFSAAQKATLESLKAYDSPELRYFMDKFIPAFSLSLDEL